MNIPPSTSDHSRLTWRAILAGAVVALSIHLLLTMLGSGISALIARRPGIDEPAKTLAIGTAIAWCLSALISLWVGGFVAGKAGATGDADSGKLHGFVVWSLATVTAFLLVALGVGGIAGMAGRAVVEVGKTAVAAAPDVVSESAKLIDGFAGEPTLAGKPITPAAKRELARELKTFLTSDASSRPAARTAAVNVLVANGTPADEANRTVDEWAKSYDQSVQELKAMAAAAAAKAGEVADQAAGAAGKASIWIFVAFWLGALAAAAGGKAGATGCLHPASPRKVITPRPGPVLP